MRRTVEASEFKARCLTLMDEVAESGKEIVLPYRATPRNLFGVDRGRIRILGDIVSPMPAEWFDDGSDSGEELF